MSLPDANACSRDADNSDVPVVHATATLNMVNSQKILARNILFLCQQSAN